MFLSVGSDADVGLVIFDGTQPMSAFFHIQLAAPHFQPALTLHLLVTMANISGSRPFQLSTLSPCVNMF